MHVKRVDGFRSSESLYEFLSDCQDCRFYVPMTAEFHQDKLDSMSQVGCLNIKVSKQARCKKTMLVQALGLREVKLSLELGSECSTQSLRDIVDLKLVEKFTIMFHKDRLIYPLLKNEVHNLLTVENGDSVFDSI